MARFIPACAGNRDAEYLTGNVDVGSSPRVRGTDLKVKSYDPEKSVHPRVCGEQCRKSLPSVAKTGSSPRVRGTDKEPDKITTKLRFIPACAGNRGYRFL